MSIKEYLENLYRLKNLAVDRWGNLTTLERQVVDESFEWLVDNLEIKKGEVVVDEELSRSMDKFLQAAIDIVKNNRGFQSKLGQFLADLTQIQKNNRAFHATTNNFDINIAGVTAVQKTVVDEIINQYIGNGLNQHFAGPLRDNIFRNLLAGANMLEIKQVLQAYILSGQDESGKLSRYLNNTAMQAVDSYTGAINQQLVQTFTFTGYIISGSLIETSSKQCIYAVERADKGYMTFDQWEEVLAIARNNPKARLIPGTTIQNLPLNKLHWGCRHDFTPVIKKAEKKEEPKKKEEEKPVELKAKGSFRVGKTKAEAKEVAKGIIQDNIDLKVSKVSVSSDLPLDLLNRMNQVLQDLTSTYKISPVVNKTAGTEIKFQSTRTKYGVVKSYNNGEVIRQINFGHLSDTNRAKVYEENPLSRPKSKVDPENEQVATVVHEFGHVISLSYQTRKLDAEHGIDFWNDLLTIQKDYAAEIRSLSAITRENQPDNKKLEEIFLGNYAYTNLNEFMAEAFTEYRLRKNPSKYAKKVGLLIDKYFKK